MKKFTFANATITLHNKREETLMDVIESVYDYTIKFYTDSNDDILYHSEVFLRRKIDEIETLLAALYYLNCVSKPISIESMLRNDIEKREKSA
jgi:hypothetical protein